VRRRRLGLRERVALVFAGLALVLTTVLGLVSWGLASGYVDRQVDASAAAQTADDAALVEAQLVNDGQNRADELLRRLQYARGATAQLWYDANGYSSVSTGDVELPADLVREVQAGATDKRRLTVDGRNFMVAGVPVGGGGAFFEVYPLNDFERSLTTLWLILGVAGVLATGVGLGVGRFVSRRLLQPLTEVTSAASAVAAGDLSARLDPEADPDLAELAESFNRTTAALETRVRADARFAGDVSHELRTPLTTMLNSMQLLQNRRDEVPARLWEPLDLLDGDLHRFRKLVVDLLDISRPEALDGAAPEPVLIGDLVRRAGDAAAGRPVTVIEDRAATLWMHADKRRLERVVTNLVENAEAHGDGCVSVNVDVSGRMVRIQVDDAGPGVPPNRRTRIFERFVRDGTGDHDGVGLGLAIVVRHVRWHGGTVEVFDAPSGGARFVVELPVAVGSAFRPRSLHQVDV
jgi:two-component system, OmpR family, sensor histidine kinase MtrB